MVTPSPWLAAQGSDEKRYAFFITGDPQYHAEKSSDPGALDPHSETANARFLDRIKSLPGTAIPNELGAGRVSKQILGMIVSGDLIDSCDKNGSIYPAMQRFEWIRYLADYGLTGKEGKLPWPVYELHGNHDGPQGDTFVIDELIRRNRKRPAVTGISQNGLHYSWNWGPLHCFALGMFPGEGETRREGHHYAPRASLEFLRADLAAQVGDSGRPVMIVFHLHPNCPEYDWPAEDLTGFWEAIQAYNVIAIIHGHTHGSPPKRNRWNGKEFSRDLPDGIDVFDPDDSAAAKTDPRNPEQGMGLAHGFLYAELIDGPGIKQDRFVVRSYFTRDNWANHQWGEKWERLISLGKR